MNSFGSRFRISTFGESHGKAIGCLLDGVPAGLKIDEEFIQSQLDRRRPGKSKVETARKELDRVEIISGTFNGYSTGTPIAMVIFNSNQKSRDYENIKIFFALLTPILHTGTNMELEIIEEEEEVRQERQLQELQVELLHNLY